MSPIMSQASPTMPRGPRRRRSPRARRCSRPIAPPVTARTRRAIRTPARRPFTTTPGSMAAILRQSTKRYGAVARAACRRGKTGSPRCSGRFAPRSQPIRIVSRISGSTPGARPTTAPTPPRNRRVRQKIENRPIAETKTVSISLPPVSPPLPTVQRWKRDVDEKSALRWLSKGWRDFATYPGLSLVYGVLVFPALAGFMIVAPLLAVGLYEKSRCLEDGERPTLRSMIFVKPASGGQILFAGALLCLLMLLWFRAAVIIYALFFGVRAFPGVQNVAHILFATGVGWAILIVGACTGAIFAAFSFAISAFSLPMLLDKPVDAFTAMGTSVAWVWNNLNAMLAWGAIVLALMLISMATGLIGLIVLFPVVGHGTWAAYREFSSSPAGAGSQHNG